MFSPGAALVGGALIGLSASALLVLDGRVAGISGIVGGLLRPRRGEVAWRLAFVVGLLAGGFAVAQVVPGSVVPRPGVVPLWLLAIAGALVGVGTSMSGGCTSGHGVCGLSRFSKRSTVAVATFMATGALAVFFLHHVVRLP
jgi:uncharacterized membrane protein YedE/YeeE